MAYNLAKFRELIRLTLDLDATDLPDTLVDEWVRDGATRAQTRRQEWPFFQYDWTFTGSEGVSNYTFTFIEDGGAEKIAEIRQVRGPSWDLRWQDIATRDRYRSRDSDTSGSPNYWSVWNNGELVLDPAPANSDDTFVIRGYKKPKDWVGAVDPGDQVSDMPAEFDSPILNWALGRAYAQQDEPQTALYYADLADLRLRELVKFYDDPSPAISVTMGGDYNRNMYPLADPRFAWE